MRAPYELRLIQTGIVGGLAASIFYPVMLFLPLSETLTVIAAGLLGPAIAVGSIGLWQFISLHERRATASVATVFNLLASALFTAMVLVQLAARLTGQDADFVAPVLVPVWLGLDVAWDAYIGLGTMLFAGAMLTHPHFGKIFGYPGLLIGFAVLALNFQSFPTPPAEAGSFDVGPLVGLWYLAVTLQILRNISWARQKLIN